MRTDDRVIRDLLYGRDEHLMRDTKFPELRGQQGGCGNAGAARRGSGTVVANLRAAHDRGECPALRVTRYFCNRGLEQLTTAIRQLVLVVRTGSVIPVAPRFRNGGASVDGPGPGDPRGCDPLTSGMP
jgi:hypothetical protein